MFLFLCIPLPVLGQIQITEEDYARAEQQLSQSVSKMVYHRMVNPNWLADEAFWYQHEAPGSVRYMYVDPDAGVHRPLFDHNRLAGALSEVLQADISAVQLSLSRLEVTGTSMSFNMGENAVSCEIETYACTVMDRPKAAGNTVPRMSVVSPDGKLAAFRRDNNLWVHEIATGSETQLTFDGEEDFGIRHKQRRLGAQRPARRPVVTGLQKDCHISARRATRRRDVHG